MNHPAPQAPAGAPTLTPGPEAGTFRVTDAEGQPLGTLVRSKAKIHLDKLARCWLAFDPQGVPRGRYWHAGSAVYALEIEARKRSKAAATATPL